APHPPRRAGARGAARRHRVRGLLARRDARAVADADPTGCARGDPLPWGPADLRVRGAVARRRAAPDPHDGCRPLGGGGSTRGRGLDRGDRGRRAVHLPGFGSSVRRPGFGRLRRAGGWPAQGAYARLLTKRRVARDPSRGIINPTASALRPDWPLAPPPSANPRTGNAAPRTMAIGGAENTNPSRGSRCKPRRFSTI